MIRIDFADPRQQQDHALRCAFEQPLRVLTAHQPAQVPALLDAVQDCAKRGLWCVGYLRFEAASAFDAALKTHPGIGPLAWFAIFDQARPWPAEAPSSRPGRIEWLIEPKRAVFDASLAALHQGMQAGEFYQVNYTAMLHGRFDGRALDLFGRLQQAQPGGYAAFIDTGDEQILSISPELFFDWDGQHILTRPMKGTAARGHDASQDQRQIQQLLQSSKERAENVMITDLLRNDLSCIAQPFSVTVPRLFALQTLPTLHQMVSDVSAKTRPGTNLRQVFGALFPCGSVTGAPKVRAMQAIAALETEPRGVYCGAIGVVRPGGHATFNVAIRSLTLQGEKLSCGIGSGITFDSSSSSEWLEWQHKRAFLQRASEPFELLETLRWQGGQYQHLDAHLRRLAQAAQHFGYPFDAAKINAALQALFNQPKQAPPELACGVWRVRIRLNNRGHVQIDKCLQQATAEPVLLGLAARAFTEAHSEFTRFKTTQRRHYEAFYPSDEKLFDTLLYNNDGQLTECTRGNIAVLLDGKWRTPALHCGLLAGIGRAHFLAQGQLQEAVITLPELAQAQGLAFINSLRGWLAARLQASDSSHV